MVSHMHTDKGVKHERIGDRIDRTLELQLVEIDHRHRHDAGLQPLKTDRADQSVADAKTGQALVVLSQARIGRVRGEINNRLTKFVCQTSR